MSEQSRPPRLILGQNYYVQTLRYDYIGRLAEVGPGTMTLEDAVIVYETGAMAQFWEGTVARYEEFGTTCQHWQGWQHWPHPIPKPE